MNPAIHSRRRIDWATPGTIKLTSDGNSITAGGQDGGASGDGIIGQTFAGSTPIAPFNLQTYANFALSGQTTAQMIAACDDVSGSYDPNKFNVLFAQELTNTAGNDFSAADTVQQFLDYLALVQSIKPWQKVIVATAPPAWRGDDFSQAANTEYNTRLEQANAILRVRYRERADVLFETRQEGSPYAQSRYPDYLRATFFSTTVVNGISNTATWTNEANQVRIHYTAAGIALLKPLFADCLLRMPL